MNTAVHAFAAGAQAHADAGGTERAARDRIAPKAGQLRGRVLAAVAAAGNEGLTAVEATEALGYNMAQLYSVAPRFAELIRQGYVLVGGRRGDRQFYVATAAGSAWAESQR
jgi:hypothetical protein